MLLKVLECLIFRKVLLAATAVLLPHCLWLNWSLVTCQCLANRVKDGGRKKFTGGKCDPICIRAGGFNPMNKMGLTLFQFVKPTRNYFYSKTLLIKDGTCEPFNAFLIFCP